MTDLFADIIIDISHEKLDKVFQYRIPEKLRDLLEPGMCVTVPFGTGNRQIKGYVVRITEECSYDPAKLKSIIEIAPKGVSVEEKMISLAGWIKRNYGSTMIQALKTVLPAKQSVKKLEHRTICRVMSREDTVTVLGESIRKKQAAKERLLRTLLETETIPYEWVTGKLGVTPQTI